MVPPRRMAVALPLSPAQEAIGGGNRLRPVDLLLLGYLTVISVVVTVRLRRHPAGWWLLLAHGLFLILLFLLSRPGLGPVGRAIRELYPLLLLAGLYSELDVLN